MENEWKKYIIKEFYEFLRAHGALESYFAELSADINNHNHYLSIKVPSDFLKIVHPLDFLSLAFVWGLNTKWSKINTDWLDYCLYN